MSWGKKVEDAKNNNHGNTNNMEAFFDEVLVPKCKEYENIKNARLMFVLRRSVEDKGLSTIKLEAISRGENNPIGYIEFKHQTNLLFEINTRMREGRLHSSTAALDGNPLEIVESDLSRFAEGLGIH